LGDLDKNLSGQEDVNFVQKGKSADEMRQDFQSKAQVLKQNVRKRLKTFENIRKLSKSCVKRSKIFKNHIETFENI
jgi:hypothetical protein